MGRMQRAKGARVERELCTLLKQWGVPAKRDLAQYQASSGRDITLDVPLCIQVKGGRKPPYSKAYAEACSAAEPGEMPIAAIRPDGSDWRVVMSMLDFLNLLAKAGIIETPISD